jgi:UPF0716 protein FxsA
MPFVLLYLVVEIVAVVALGSWIGALPTLLVLLAGSVLGLWLARREGLRAAQALADAARNRRVATSETTDGMLVAAGGLLIFVPGLVTDVLGLLLVLPPTRALVRRRLVASTERRHPDLRTARIRGEGQVIDAEVVDVQTDGHRGAGPDAPRRPAGPMVVEGTVVDQR